MNYIADLKEWATRRRAWSELLRGSALCTELSQAIADGLLAERLELLNNHRDALDQKIEREHGKTLSAMLVCAQIASLDADSASQLPILLHQLDPTFTPPNPLSAQAARLDAADWRGLIRRWLYTLDWQPPLSPEWAWDLVSYLWNAPRQMIQHEMIRVLLLEERGILGNLECDLLAEGRGAVYTDPECMSFVRFDSSMRRAIEAATEYVRGVGIWGEEFDVRWRVRRLDGEVLSWLEGASMGGAFALAYTKLLALAAPPERVAKDELLESLLELDLSVVAATATVTEDGKLGAVGDIWAKQEKAVQTAADARLLNIVVVSQDQHGVLDSLLTHDAAPLRVIRAHSVAEAVEGLYHASAALAIILGPKFHLFTFKEYAKRLSEWVLKFKETTWHGQYTELTAKRLGILVFAKRLGKSSSGQIYISDVINQNELVLIVGERGSGKTTALLHTVRTESQLVVRNETERIPVFVPLNAWTEEHDLESLISSNLAALGRQLDRQTLLTYLAEGRFSIAFDGINEIPSAKRAKGAEFDLTTFAKNYSMNHIVVTTRPIGYNPNAFEGWPIYEIQPLDRESILDFATKYLGHESARQLYSRLGGDDPSQWEKPNSLLTLGRNPLYLWMLIETFDQAGDLPRDKGALIKRFVDYILQSREQGKASLYNPLVKMRLLRSIAFQMTEAGQIVRIEMEKALEICTKELQTLKEQSLWSSELKVVSVLEEISSNGLFLSENDISARWSHQIYQEFFGALELASRFRDRIPIWRQLNNVDWKESAIIAAGLTEQPEKYLDEVMNGWRGWLGLLFFQNSRTLLAINCVNETKLWENEQIRERIIPVAKSRIARGLNQTLVDFSGTISRAFGRPLSGVALRFAQLHFESFYVLGPILWYLGETGGQRASTVLSRHLKSQHREIRWIAADALRKIRDPDTIYPLMDALNDNDGDVRWQVIQALINLGDERASRSVVSLLNDTDPTTRWAAAFALGKIGTEADLLDLESAKINDHSMVWWGESVSQVAATSIAEIQLRVDQKLKNRPQASNELFQRVYYKRQND